VRLALCLWSASQGDAIVVEVEDSPMRANNDVLLALERRRPGEAVSLGAGAAPRRYGCVRCSMPMSESTVLGCMVVVRASGHAA
jgi:hypothetical protein